MGKTRDIFKKIRDNKGEFHAQMGTIKDKNGMDLIEAEDIKKRWQEYTEKLYTLGLLGSSPGGGKGNPLQYFCLGKPMDRGLYHCIEGGNQNHP